jgi:hypothetical protein
MPGQPRSRFLPKRQKTDQEKAAEAKLPALKALRGQFAAPIREKAKAMKDAAEALQRIQAEMQEKCTEEAGTESYERFLPGSILPADDEDGPSLDAVITAAEWAEKFAEQLEGDAQETASTSNPAAQGAKEDTAADSKE